MTHSKVLPIYVYVAVAGRKQTLFLLLFDKVYTVITQSQNKLKDSKIIATNSHLSTMTVLTFGLNC